jgi:hypothetical protein
MGVWEYESMGVWEYGSMGAVENLLKLKDHPFPVGWSLAIPCKLVLKVKNQVGP